MRSARYTPSPFGNHTRRDPLGLLSPIGFLPFTAPLYRVSEIVCFILTPLTTEFSWTCRGGNGRLAYRTESVIRVVAAEVAGLQISCVSGLSLVVLIIVTPTQIPSIMFPITAIHHTLALRRRSQCRLLECSVPIHFTIKKDRCVLIQQRCDFIGLAQPTQCHLPDRFMRIRNGMSLCSPIHPQGKLLACCLRSKETQGGDSWCFSCCGWPVQISVSIDNPTPKMRLKIAAKRRWSCSKTLTFANSEFCQILDYLWRAQIDFYKGLAWVVIFLDGMRALYCIRKFQQMGFIFWRKNNSQTVLVNGSIGQYEPQPICLLFRSNHRKERVPKSTCRANLV
jgi:hypothetical protein